MKLERLNSIRYSNAVGNIYYFIKIFPTKINQLYDRFNTHAFKYNPLYGPVLHHQFNENLKSL